MYGKPLSATLSTTSGFSTLTPLAPFYQQRAYLLDRSATLMSDLHTIQCQKQYYRNKLHSQARSSQQQLQQTYQTLNVKQHQLINLQQQLQRQRKQLRLMSDDYLTLKRQSESDKHLSEQQLKNMERQCQEKLQELTHRLRNEHEIAMRERVQGLEKAHSEVVEVKDRQIRELARASEGVVAELRKLQDQHKMMLMKIDGMVQDELQKELRVRDRKERENYAQDMAYREALRKETEALRGELVDRQAELQKARAEAKEYRERNSALEKEIDQLRLSIEAMERRRPAPAALPSQQPEQDHQQLHAETNTGGGYLPIPMPTSDLSLITALQSLRQFIGSALLQILSQIFAKSSSQSLKGKNPASLSIFTLNLNEAKQSRREIALVVYCYSKLRELLQEYCPAAVNAVDVVTLKEGFVRACLEECQGLSAKPVQQLFRLLELRSRILTPINHTKTLQNLSEQAKQALADRIVEASVKAILN